MNKQRNGKNFKFKKPKKFFDNKESEGKPNAISWYAQNPLLLKIAGLVNFLKPVGAAINIIAHNIVNSFTFTGGTMLGMYKRIPGICRLNWIPTPGIVKDPNDPVNKSMAKLFTQMRLKNFSLTAYDQADVMMYILACDSLFAMFAYMTLVYAHVKEWKFTNDYYPKAILEALHADYNDIVENLPSFLFYINVCQEALKVLKVPKRFSFIARHMHMSAQVYKDSENEKAQMYVFVPDYLYKYVATTPSLDPVLVGTRPNPLTFNDIKSIMDSLMNAILPDEDMNIIAADIAKFVGSDYWTVNPLDYNASLTPVYNKEMLWQIHNSNFLQYASASGLSITQQVTGNLDTIIHFDPTFIVSSGLIGLKRIIDSNSETPTPEEVVESTRLMFTIDSIVQNSEFNFTVKLDHCGSEIITAAQMIIFKDDNQLTTIPLTTYINSVIATAPSGTGYVLGFPITSDSDGNLIYGQDLASMTLLSQFQYHPIVYMGVSTGQSSMPCFLNVLSELDNYAVIENDQLNALHEQSLLSEFDLGTVIS